MILNSNKKISGDIVKRKRTPMRTCIGCRQVRPKMELIRIVRTPEGSVEIDPTGKKSGRGAYICSSTSCLEIAIGKNQIERALNVKVSPEIKALLKEKLQ